MTVVEPNSPSAVRHLESNGEIVVSVRGLTKVFKDFWNRPKARAVDNVDFDVRRGEVFGLLGPNGSGKCTTVTRMRAVGEFSKGMQRRIGLAQALINDPDLVILDEPTSGLDPIGCREVKDLIVALARRGKTVILSSHPLSDVEDVCDRVVIYYGGRI